MLSAPNNRLDMSDALNAGKIVLVNTAKDFLKGERSSFLGRYFIALTLQAALERAAMPEGKRRPAFLYIDEAAEYFDDNIDNLLTQARKYKLGVVFRHQYLDQLARRCAPRSPPTRRSSSPAACQTATPVRWRPICEPLRHSFLSSARAPIPRSLLATSAT